MPREFWEWYENQNMPWDMNELWEMEDHVKKPILAGLMIKYLIHHKGIAIGPPKKFTQFNDFYNWLRTGTEWA